MHMVVASFTGSIDQAWDTFWDWLPQVAAAILILIIAWIVAKIVASLVRRLLVRVGLDRLVESRGPDLVKRATTSLSGALGTLAFWLILLAGFGIAADALGVDALERAVDEVWGYIPNVLAAVAILVIAGFLAPWVSKLLAAALPGKAIGRILGTVAPVLILAVAVFMALDQLEIANNIVTITYASIMGAVALGMALAFGLGGRDQASRVLQGAYDLSTRPQPPDAPPTSGV
jgi:hypothetical protein